MKTKYLIAYIILIWVFFAKVAFGQVDVVKANNVELYYHVNQWGSTNVWFTSQYALTNAPKWKAGEEEPPLSLGKAIDIAKKQMVYPEGKGVYWIEEIAVTPFAPTSDTGIYYYNIVFGGVSYVGHLRRCIMLMDGTIVQPQILGVKSKHYDPSSFDE